jgi:vancomycin resistance protein YoaR
MKNGRKYLAALGVSVVTLAIVWLGMWLAVGSAIPPKTKILDVDISRLSIAEASEKLSRERATDLQGELHLVVDSKKFSLPVKDSGVELDIGKSLAAVPSRSGNPIQLLSLLFREKSIEAIVLTDKENFSRAIRMVEREVNIAPKNADIVYDGIVPTLVNARPGKALDRDSALRKVAENWLRSDSITLETKVRQARISDEEATVLLEFAQKAVSAPVEVVLNIDEPVTFSLTPTVISQALTFIPGRGEKLEAKWLKATFINAVGRKWSAHVVEPVNASFTMSGGEPRVQPSRDGLDVPEEKLSNSLLEALGKSGVERKVTLTPEPVPAKITTEMVGGLGIKEVIGTFTTFFPYAEYRIINIQRAARWMDGVIIKPGEVFSYNKVVGERTEARGFVPGIMIDRGVFKKDWGGGVSQVATTTWNAAWFSGLELVQHKPHSFYISRYPAGRESTVAWPSVDVKFRNNSGNPIFVDTSFTNRSVTVTIYGSKFIDVETESGPRTNPQEFKVLESDSKECIFQEGVSGFTIEVWRILKRDGVEIKREKFRTRYRPEDRIICTNPEARWMNPPIEVQRGLAKSS